MKKFFVTMLLVLLTAPSFAQIGGGGFSIDEDREEVGNVLFARFGDGGEEEAIGALF